MVGGGDPGRLRDARGVGDVFTRWEMYFIYRKVTILARKIALIAPAHRT